MTEQTISKRNIFWLPVILIKGTIGILRAGRMIPNRRKHPRVKSHNLIRCTEKNGASMQKVSNLVDLSAGGLQYVTRDHVEPNDTLKLVVNFPERGKQIPVLAKVEWTRPVLREHVYYRTGVSFKEILKRPQRSSSGISSIFFGPLISPKSARLAMS